MTFFAPVDAGRFRRHVMVAAAALAVSSTLVIAHHASAHWDSDPYNVNAVYEHNEQCGAKDLAEGVNPDGTTYPQIQGDVPRADQTSGRAKLGYNCGLALVGHTSLQFTKDGQTRPAGGNANMAWAGRCAYVADGGVLAGPSTPSPVNGVAVIDVADSSNPKVTDVLRDPGTTQVAETINAVTTAGGRSILVVGQYGNPKLSPPPVPMDVYDVTTDPSHGLDCAHPKHMATVMWPENIHNVTVTPDGKYVIATMPLQVADISALWARTAPIPGASYIDVPSSDGGGSKVSYLGDLEQAMEGMPVGAGPTADYTDQVPGAVRQTQHPVSAGHEAWYSNDWTAGDKTLFIGAQQADLEQYFILDIRDWLNRPDGVTPKGPPKTLSDVSGRGHSTRTATINGVPYLLHSEESIGVVDPCAPETANPFAGVAQPWLTDIADRTKPRLVSQMALDINNPNNCVAATQSGVGASVHYHDVDDATDTTFVMASMGNAGIRVWDVRDPASPTEVGYFNPADVDPAAGTTALDKAWAHIRYVAEKGEIWFTTASGGFWVVRIEGGLRHHLDLDRKNVAHHVRPLHVPTDDPGRPGTIGVALPQLSLAAYASPAPYYCTIGALAAPANVATRPVGRPAS